MKFFFENWFSNSAGEPPAQAGRFPPGAFEAGEAGRGNSPTSRYHFDFKAAGVQPARPARKAQTEHTTVRINPGEAGCPPRADPQVPPPEGLPATVGRYRILGEIARGGMGVVAKAWDPQLGRYVAIKVLHEQFRTDAEITARFLTEARINGRLEHPSIVSIHELGQCETGQPFFAMRLLEGRTLSDLLGEREHCHAPWNRFLRIFEKVCDGVAFAHAHAVIHRDLKPSNIIVGDFGMVKIMDWGLAKSLLPHPSPGPPPFAPSLRTPLEKALEALDSPAGDFVSGIVVGTPAYLAPEQARGETGRVDERADVFGLGGILCQILTGSGPYPDPQPSKLEQAINGNVGPALNRLSASSADPELVDLAKRCLSPHPEDRPRCAGVVAKAITSYLASDLRRAERDLVRFFDLSLDLFCIADLTGFFRRINSNFSRVLGYSEEEMLSRPFSDFIHPDDLAQTAEAMAALSRGLPAIQFTNRYRHADGHYLYLEWVAKVETEGNNYIFAVARDVTNRYSPGALGPALREPPASKKPAKSRKLAGERVGRSPPQAPV